MFFEAGLRYNSTCTAAQGGPHVFQVKPETVEHLFNAQKPEVQGRLRLDVSSRCYPANLTQPLDKRCAVEALGERLIRLLKDCAADAADLGGDQRSFGDHVIPPAPISDRLRIMASANSFEAFVLGRLDKTLGLDRSSADYDPALQALATDFFEWAWSQREARESYGVEVDGQAAEPAVFIRCESPPREVFTPLERPEASPQEVRNGAVKKKEPPPLSAATATKKHSRKKKA
jgi:hypothetical protein